MIDFKIHIGFVETNTRNDEKPYKPFVLDLSKFPSLFIDYNYNLDKYEDKDNISEAILKKCSEFYPEDHVKCIVIDGFGIAYNSIMKPGTYKRNARKTMIKRIDSYVSKIYDKYLKNPDTFIPRTKYIILVCRIGGMEQELISIMSKLGPIGVYLIMTDDIAEYSNNPDLFKNLYGVLSCVDFYSLQNSPKIEYNPYQNSCHIYSNPKFVYTLNRLRLRYENYPTVYPKHYSTKFALEPNPIKARWCFKRKNDLPKYTVDSIF